MCPTNGSTQPWGNMKGTDIKLICNTFLSHCQCLKLVGPPWLKKKPTKVYWCQN